uniref:exodeoxyribonuclease III n=1 Tax=Kryptolebias marmoratus TaxID=37003 RepID=A0A3Q2ZLG1_KRYMA
MFCRWKSLPATDGSRFTQNQAVYSTALHQPRHRGARILSFIRAKNCQIVFIQETHLSLLESYRLGAGWVGFVGASCGSSKSRGVATLIDRRLQFKCLKQSTDKEGRMLLMLCEIQGYSIILANVYAPNVDDPSFFGLLEKKLIDLGNYPIIVAGDFNEVMDTTLDRSTTITRIPKTHIALKGMCKACCLVDVWRLQHPSGRDYTFYSPPHRSLSRIDFFLVSKSLMTAVASTNIGNIILSDHSPIYLFMSTINTTVRSARWRLNSSLLLEEAFKDSLRSQIKLYIDTNIASAPSAGVAWEALKAYLRGHIIQQASSKKKANTIKLVNLERQIEITESSFKRDSSLVNLNKLTKLKYEYNTIMSEKAEFSLFRARQKYFEEGDKAGRLLARYIKQREAMTSISAIRNRTVNSTTFNKNKKCFHIKPYHPMLCTTKRMDMLCFTTSMNNSKTEKNVKIELCLACFL